MSLTSNYRVGIGTTDPSGKLHVAGETYIENGWIRIKGNKGLFFEDYGGGLRMTDNSWIRTVGDKNFYHNKGIMRTDGSFHVGAHGDRFIVNAVGKVGIGTTNPDARLTVNGSIHSKEVKVDLSIPAPDYVFTD